MFLISRGRKPRRICTACVSIHDPEDCPKLEPNTPRLFPEAIRSQDEFMEIIRLAKQANEERYAAMGVR